MITAGMKGVSAAAGLVAIMAAGTATAQQQQPSAAPPAPTPAQIERIKQIYQPSAPHEALARLAGTWEQVVEYSSAPGRTVKTTGRVTNRVVLGGRFVVSEGKAKKAGSVPETASMLVFGYDGRTREHTIVVFDTFGTYYVSAAGTAGAGAREVVMRGETAEGSGTKKFDVVLSWIDDDTYRTKIVFNFPGRDPVVAVAATHKRVTARRDR